jgi:hypothetical protein
MSVCPQYFGSRSFSLRGVGSVKACCLTMRAADDGWAARLLGVFAALSLFRFVGESPLQPIAANASRWAPSEIPLVRLIVM